MGYTTPKRLKVTYSTSRSSSLRLMDKILHDPKDPKLWELWYIPYNGKCRILSINSIISETSSMQMRIPVSTPLSLSESWTSC